MITIGVDAHKRMHAAVAIDAQGREIAAWTGANTPAGWDALEAWAAQVGADRTWGIEGSGQYGRGLAQQLVRSGEPVVEVNPRLTADTRRRGRQRGKTDRLDALAVARTVQREEVALPVVVPLDVTAVLAITVAEREAALQEATRLRNQLHQHLFQLSATDDRAWPSLTTRSGVATLLDYLAPGTDPVLTAHAAAVRRLATRLEQTLAHVATLAAEIEALGQPVLAPLCAIRGVSDLTAGVLAAYLGSGHRFSTDAKLAMYAGVAPLPVGSAGTERQRLNRTGHRQLNAVFHRIALTQARCHPPAQEYLARKRAEGKSRPEAVRCLKRYLVRAVFRAWQQCEIPPLPPPP